MTTSYNIPACGSAVAIWGGQNGAGDITPKIHRPGECADGWFVSGDKVLMVGEEHKNFQALLAHAIANERGFKLPTQCAAKSPLHPMQWGVIVSKEEKSVLVYYSPSEQSPAFWLCEDGDISEDQADKHNFFAEYYALMLVERAQAAQAGDPKYRPGENAATPGHVNPTEQQKKERRALLQFRADGLALIEALTPHTLDKKTRGHPERSRALAITALKNATKDATEVVMGESKLPEVSDAMKRIIAEMKGEQPAEAEKMDAQGV